MGGGGELPLLKRPAQRCCFPDKAAVGMCVDEAAHAAVTVEQCNELLDTKKKRTCVSLSLAQCQYDSTCNPAVARRSLYIYLSSWTTAVVPASAKPAEGRATKQE